MGKNDVIDVVRRYKDKVVSLMGPATVYLYGSYRRITWDVDTLIEPVLIDARYPSPLYEDILSTGVEV